MSELNRLKHFDKAKGKSQRAELVKRFERERSVDQQRIENLTCDYKALQEMHASGALASAKDLKNKSSSGGSSDISLHNRFAGFETRDKMVGIIEIFMVPYYSSVPMLSS